MNLFAELKRRNVYKVAAAYAVVGWLIIQVATQVFPFFEIPNWAVRLIVLVIVIGFPIALVIAWAFELTPEGLKRTEDVDLAASARQPRKHAWIFVVIIAGAMSLGLFFLGRMSAPNKQSGANEVSSKSIAVLPFVNMSSDRENEYFVDGLTEEILSRLAQISALRVPGRTSSFAFKGKSTDLRQIGNTLSVAHVLEGSVRKSGDRLRITAQVVRTADGFHLWSQSYDRKLDDIFAVQEEIARAIAESLSTPLGLKENAGPSRQTKDMEAYDNFLQARGLLVERTGEKLRRALDLLNAAVQRDPNFASGWAALAQARALSLYFLSDVADPLKGAEEAARKALALDDSIAMAHSALADVLRDRWDWLAAEKEYQRALQLSPAEAETHNQYAQMLLKVGRLDGALQHALHACELDPLAWVPPSVVSITCMSRGDFAKSREFLDRSEKISGRLRGFHTRTELFLALSQQDPDRARRALDLALTKPSETWSSNPPGPKFFAVMDQALSEFQKSGGVTIDLGKSFQEIRASGHQDTGLPFSAVAAIAGQNETALDALFVELETPGNDIAAVIWTPVYQKVRREPRFREFVRAMKMPEYWRVAGWSDFCRARGDTDFDCNGP